MDRVLGLEGESPTPVVASLMADVVGDAGYEMVRSKLANLAGVTIPPSTLHMWALKIGKQVQRFEQEIVAPADPAAPRLYLSVDGTGVPVRKSEVAGVKGKQEDGSAKTREAKVLSIYTAKRVHRRAFRRRPDVAGVWFFRSQSGQSQTCALGGGRSTKRSESPRSECFRNERDFVVFHTSKPLPSPTML